MTTFKQALQGVGLVTVFALTVGCAKGGESAMDTDASASQTIDDKSIAALRDQAASQGETKQDFRRVGLTPIAPRAPIAPLAENGNQTSEQRTQQAQVATVDKSICGRALFLNSKNNLALASTGSPFVFIFDYPNKDKGIYQCTLYAGNELSAVAIKKTLVAGKSFHLCFEGDVLAGYEGVVCRVDTVVSAVEQ